MKNPLPDDIFITSLHRYTETENRETENDIERNDQTADILPKFFASQDHKGIIHDLLRFMLGLGKRQEHGAKGRSRETFPTFLFLSISRSKFPSRPGPQCKSTIPVVLPVTIFF